MKKLDASGAWIGQRGKKERYESRETKTLKYDRDSPYTGCHANTRNPQTPAICKNW
jgi:hypothetical protein